MVFEVLEVEGAVVLLGSLVMEVVEVVEVVEVLLQSLVVVVVEVEVGLMCYDSQQVIMVVVETVADLTLRVTVETVWLLMAGSLLLLSGILFHISASSAGGLLKGLHHFLILCSHLTCLWN